MLAVIDWSGVLFALYVSGLFGLVALVVWSFGPLVADRWTEHWRGRK